MRSVEIEQLIEDLQAEKPHSAVQVQPQSKMVVVIEDTNARHVFEAEECRLLLSSRSTVERIFEALDYPDDVFIELHDLVIDPEIMAELESYASTVDEM